jgi:hypothetical protein
MSRGKRIALSMLGLYLAGLGVAWVWFHPSLVNKRIHKQISIGARASDVVKAFQIHEPFDTEIAAYCGNEGPQKITKIAIYNVGSVPLLPLPMVLATTTTFCFDTNDILVGIETRRWFDGP